MDGENLWILITVLGFAILQILTIVCLFAEMSELKKQLLKGVEKISRSRSQAPSVMEEILNGLK